MRFTQTILSYKAENHVDQSLSQIEDEKALEKYIYRWFTAYIKPKIEIELTLNRMQRLKKLLKLVKAVMKSKI